VQHHPAANNARAVPSVNGGGGGGGGARDAARL